LLYEGDIDMKKIILAAMMLILISSPAFAGGGLDGFMHNLNIRARADMPGFSAQVSTQFGVPLPRVEAVIRMVDTPADAFMCFQLAEMSRKPYDTVTQVYQTHRGQGWGVIAKRLGIKPGSSEFHALKRGDFVLSGEPGRSYGKGKEKAKGKGKGHNK
jgi:hypothetical protein